MANPTKLFAGSATRYLAEKIAENYGEPLGKIALNKFSDGEFAPSYEESIRGRDIFLIQSTFAPTENLFELLLMIDAAKRASAKKIVAVIPYFGFARQDRKDKPRVAIGAKLVANLLTSAGVKRIVTMDLHADQIQGFFEVPVDHLYASGLFIEYIKSLNLPNLVIAAPDTGGTKRANSYAKHLGSDMAICYKHRKIANQVESMTLIGDVKGKDVVLIDDIVDTGGTLVKAAQIMLDNGATSVRAMCTHAVLSGPAYERINESCLTELVVTDTIPLKQESDKIRVISTAPLFADVISRIQNLQSISSHFVVS
ncbi:MAG TPA: ribose-phosphate pyrophosphokinase [Luteibaculaceae bacterium]|nr:ribose-phosphate pyrophosphokinase [Luteibaculaceae bacterium]